MKDYGGYTPAFGKPAKKAKKRPSAKKKYNNKSCGCNNGHIHRSRFEAKVCNDLHYEYQGCEIKTEVKFAMVVEGVTICNHYMDFIVVTKDGEKPLAVEAKGFSTSTWKIKSKLFVALYPEYEYQIRYYK